MEPSTVLYAFTPSARLLSPSPSSTSYNYHHDDPRLDVGGMLAVIWVETILAVIFVVLRTWARLTVARKLWLDDYICYISLLMLLAQTALYTPSVPIFYTLIDVVDGVTMPGPKFESQSTLYLKLQFAMILFFWTCIWSVKFSFLAFYRKLFNPATQKWKYRALLGVTVICAGTYIGCIITQFLSCQPLLSYFSLGQCQTAHDLYVSNTSLYYSSAVDIICDLLIMALPLSILPRLSSTRRRKVELVGIFSIGFLIIVFAILRLIKTHPNNSHVNPKWLCVLSITEASVAVMVSCAPALRSVFVESTKQSRSWSSSRNKSNSTETGERSPSTIPLHQSMPSLSKQDVELMLSESDEHVV